jgi:hypothetical protein
MKKEKRKITGLNNVTLCELLLKMYKFMQFECAVAYRLKYTTGTLILLPATSCRDWVRYQESCGLDLVPFVPLARSNFQDSRSKRACLLQ